MPNPLEHVATCGDVVEQMCRVGQYVISRAKRWAHFNARKQDTEIIGGLQASRSGIRTVWHRSAMPDLQYERLSTSDEPLDDGDNSPRSRSSRNTPLKNYLLLALTFVFVAFCSYKAGQWSARHPQHTGGDISTGTPKPKPDNSSTDAPTMPSNGKYSVG